MATIDPTTGALNYHRVFGARSDTLRNLAQLAVNMVDYIDSDDISTRFVWNNNLTDVKWCTASRRRDWYLNEAYGEVVNDPTDPAFERFNTAKAPNKDAQIRFWLEVLNPTSRRTACRRGRLVPGR